ncbi:hypothetical protein D3C73_745490 [compost metagenome]
MGLRRTMSQALGLEHRPFFALKLTYLHSYDFRLLLQEGEMELVHLNERKSFQQKE